MEEALESFRRACLHERLQVLPLVENLESLVSAAVRCDPSLERRAEGALDKDLNARDKFFNFVAAMPSRSVRDCILAEVPSFGEVRDAVLGLLGPMPGPAAGPS